MVILILWNLMNLAKWFYISGYTPETQNIQRGKHSFNFDNPYQCTILSRNDILCCFHAKKKESLFKKVTKIFSTSRDVILCYIIFLKFEYNITKEISNSPTKLKLVIFFLLYKYVTKKYMLCDINRKQLYWSIIKHGQDI